MIPTSEWLMSGLLRASAGLAVAALAVAACVRLMRSRAPKAEQWAWIIVLAHGVILVPVTIPVPSGLRALGTAPLRDRAAVLSSKSPRTSGGAELGMAGRAPDVEPSRPRPRDAGPSAGQVATIRRPADVVRPSWPLAALIAWLAGVLALLALGFLRHRSFARRLRGARPADPEWQAHWRRILDGRAIRAPIPLVVSRDTGPALCWSAAGYRLVVPASLWAGLAPHERTAILCHELEHYRRGDLWTTLLARGLAVLHWFNPLAWWTAGRFEVQCEFLCDRASAGADPSAFAAMLVRLGSGRPDRIGVVRSAAGGSLFERIQRLLDDAPRPARWKSALPIAAAVLALGTTSVRLQSVGASDAPAEQAGATGSRPPLPPRALLRIGTGDLRVRYSSISGMAFSPDERLIAAAEMNTDVPEVSLFDVRSGRLTRLIRPPDRPRGWVQCVAFSPDRAKLAWGEIGGQIALWDLAADRLLFRETLHNQAVNDVTFSPDGQVLASGGEDGAVHLRRAGDPRIVVQTLATGERQLVRRAFTGLPAGKPLPVGPLHLAFAPDGETLIVGSGSGATISVWRIKDSRLVRRIENAHGNFRGLNPGLSFVAVTPDGRRILSAGQSTVPIGQTQLKYGPRNVTLTEIRLWDLETGGRIKDLQGGGEEHHGRGEAALSRDGRRLAVGDFGSLRILDTATGRTERSIPLPGCGCERPVFSPDGTLVAVAIQNAVGIFEVETGRRLHHDDRTPGGELASAAWSPAGDRIVTGHGDGEVRVWEAATGKLLWHRLLAPVISPSGWNARPAFVAFSGDGRRVVAAGRRDDPVEYRNGIVATYDASTGRPEHLADMREVRWAALAPDGRTVVVATTNGSWDDIQLLGIDLGAGRALWSNPAEEPRPGFVQLAGLGFRPDSSAFEAALRDGNVIRLDALTGRERRRFVADGRTPEQREAGRPRKPGIFAAAFSADGRTMASSSGEWVCVWDVEAGMLRRRIPSPNPHGCFLSLSPDGKTVATSGILHAWDFGPDTIRLHDTETGEPVLALESADDRADVLAFSPDGSRLFTGFLRGTAIVWDVRRGQETRARTMSP